MLAPVTTSVSSSVLRPSLTPQDRQELRSFAKLQEQFLTIMTDLPKLVLFIDALSSQNASARSHFISNLIEFSESVIQSNSPRGFDRAGILANPSPSFSLAEPVSIPRLSQPVRPPYVVSGVGTPASGRYEFNDSGTESKFVPDRAPRVKVARPVTSAASIEEQRRREEEEARLLTQSAGATVLGRRVPGSGVSPLPGEV